MYKFNKYLWSGLIALALLGTACDFSDFADTNVNPNATEVPVTSALLTSVIRSTGDLTQSPIQAGLYTQYFSESQYTDDSRYNIVDRSWASNLTGALGADANDPNYGGLVDLQQIIDVNTNPDTRESVQIFGSNANQIAVARILKAYHFSLLTDMYGDIPYSQALTGEVVVPYDPQEQVYDSLFAELDAAVAQFDDGAPARGDILFEGDIEKWKKFANTLRMVLALRISNVNPDKGKAQFTDALASDGGVMESNDDNATVEYPGGVFRNPWFELYNGRKDFAISNTLVNILSGLDDPRLFVFGNPAPNGNVIGVPYGLPREQAVDFISRNPGWGFILEESWRQENSPVFVLVAADAYLARAEAAQLGWTSENAADLYRAGIMASWEQWGVFDQAAFNAYMSQPEVSLSGAGDPLAKIRLQRWLSFYPKGLQGWALWRRTAVPGIQPTQFAVNPSKQIPRRLAYPSTEQNLNPEAWQAAVDRMGGQDTPDQRLWWDK